MRPVRANKTQIEATNWVRGLITEASPLNFPEGASVDEENFILDRDGSRRRRYGMEYEEYYTTMELGSSISSVAIQNFLWKNVNEEPENSFWVHQFGNQLYMSSVDNTTLGYVGTLQFGAPISLTATTNVLFSFANLQGNLVVATGDQTLRIISASQDASGTWTRSVTFTRLKVRDFWGIDDTLATDERFTGTFSSTVGARHAYNLYNQGWPPEFFCSSDPENPVTMNNGAVEDPVARTYTSIGAYPSNADVMVSAMTFLTNGRKAYYPHALNNVASGNTPAANGHYIIDLFDRSQGRKDAYDADVAAGWSARFNYKSYVPTDQSTGGIKAIAAYAGRIFYCISPGEVGGDSRSPHLGTFVLFSQLTDSSADLAKCYQEADPTAEDISDLIDTDGGYIQLPDAVNIKALVPFRASLLVFADNGVWEIAGGERGFTATEYQSRFLSNNGAISGSSIVVTPDSVVYWSRNGIYMLGVGEGGISIQSISERTIQTLYNGIPYSSKKYAVGYYDDVEYRLRWLYQEDFESATPHRYTHELILDLSMPAWSRFHFKDIDLSVSGVVSPRVSGYIELPIETRDNAGTNFKYSTIVQQNDMDYYVIPSYCWRRNFADWFERDSSATSTASRGADALAYLVTGYIV